MATENDFMDRMKLQLDEQLKWQKRQIERYEKEYQEQRFYANLRALGGNFHKKVGSPLGRILFTKEEQEFYDEYCKEENEIVTGLIKKFDGR